MTLREWFDTNGYRTDLDITMNLLTIKLGKRHLTLSLDALECVDTKGLEAPISDIPEIMTMIQEQMVLPIESHDSVEAGLRQRHDS